MMDGILNGASLRTVMIPDDAISSNNPEHIESFHLSHIITKGDSFWGKSEATHVGDHLGEEPYPLCSFCYTNIGNIFCSYMPSSNRCVFMSKKIYRKHAWRIRNDFNLLWDSEQDDLPEKIREKIEQAAKMKIVMLDEEDVWNIHPITLPMYYKREQRFELKSAGDAYPMIFRDPNETLGYLERHRRFFDIKRSDNHLALMDFDVKVFSSFYVLKSDGTYHSYYDIPRGTSHRYKRLKVFVENS